jgi:hypothetical protein
MRRRPPAPIASNITYSSARETVIMKPKFYGQHFAPFQVAFGRTAFVSARRVPCNGSTASWFNLPLRYDSRRKSK